MSGPLTRAVRARAAAAVAGMRGVAAGLSPIQIEALMRYARDEVLRGKASSARAVANARRMAAEMTSQETDPCART